MRRSMASMSGVLAYAMVMWFCAVCRVRALDLMRMSAAGAFADVHRSFQRVWPCVQKNIISWLVHRSLVLYRILCRVLGRVKASLVLCSTDKNETTKYENSRNADG
jgi:uncharacterized membrane protein